MLAFKLKPDDTVTLVLPDGSTVRVSVLDVRPLSHKVTVGFEAPRSVLITFRHPPDVPSPSSGEVLLSWLTDPHAC